VQQLIKRLLDAGANVNAIVNNTARARIREGTPRLIYSTVLMRAVWSGDLELTKLLLAKGARLVLADLNDHHNHVASLTKQFGAGRVFFQQCDVVNQKQLASCFAFTVSKFGRLDIVINSAGIGENTDISSSTTDEIPKDWLDTLNIDVTGLINATRLAVRQMIVQNTAAGKKQGGIIINIASVAGLLPMNFCPVYCGAKHAVVGFTRSLDKLQADHGIRANCLCPGFTRTPLVALGVANNTTMKKAVDLMGMLETSDIALVMMSMIENKDSKYPGGAVISVTKGNGELLHDFIPLNKKNTYNNPYIKILQPNTVYQTSKL